MPFTVPLPVGGFATELGSLTERIRSLEATRSGVVTASVSGTWSGSYSTWTTISGWPNLTVNFSTLAGVVVIFGGSGEQSNASYTELIGLFVDGTLVQAVNLTLGNSATLSNIPGGSVWWAPMTLGSHTFELQASNYDYENSVTGTGYWNSAFLAVVPL